MLYDYFMWTLKSITGLEIKKRSTIVERLSHPMGWLRMSAE